ncbi:hypothetical protein [Marivirga arenosa]|uniref:hypothetical protein n=1 Tax=Marivirga arenosa TaxID=3059076 RepID=UPI002AC8F6AE|nr:hypothetical protein [Marivirga sp. BKB1-2]
MMLWWRLNITFPEHKTDHFIISGTGENGEDNVILIELKQWSKATLTEKDAIVTTRFAHGEKETVHPSYQAWSYSMLLRGYNAAVYEGKINLFPCAYLHNYNDDGIISNEFYKDHITNAPLFVKEMIGICQTLYKIWR